MTDHGLRGTISQWVLLESELFIVTKLTTVSYLHASLFESKTRSNACPWSYNWRNSFNDEHHFLVLRPKRLIPLPIQYTYDMTILNEDVVSVYVPMRKDYRMIVFCVARLISPDAKSLQYDHGIGVSCRMGHSGKNRLPGDPGRRRN